MTETYYRYIFEDGYSVFVKGFSEQELKIEERKHGRLMKKIEVNL